MHLFFSYKSIVLFEFLTVGEKRSKQIKGPHHYHIKGKQAAQEKNLYHIRHHES
jgi:hypothetical protein